MSDPREPDERPRPQFGEYATPDEQRAHIRESIPAPLTPMQTPLTPAAAHTPAPSATPAARPGRVQPGNPIDRVITLVLLGLGAAAVIIMTPALFSFAATMGPTFIQMGIPEEAANAPRDQTPYTWAGVVLVLGYVVTLALSLWLRRRGKISSWVPVVGSIVTWIAVFSIMTPALTADPGFVAYVEMMTAGTLPTPTP